MLNLKRILMSSCVIVAASLAHADTSGDRDSFRALTAVAIADAPLTLNLKPVKVEDEASASKGVLNKGDKISFEVEGVKGSTIYILNMDSTGEIQMLYPNKFQTADAPEAEATLMLPAKDASYEFEVTGEPGVEIVKVIAVQGEATVLEALLETLFDKRTAFPRAVSPADKTSSALAEFFSSDAASNVRETSFEYVISK